MGWSYGEECERCFRQGAQLGQRCGRENGQGRRGAALSCSLLSVLLFVGYPLAVRGSLPRWHGGSHCRLGTRGPQGQPWPQVTQHSLTGRGDNVLVRCQGAGLHQEGPGQWASAGQGSVSQSTQNLEQQEGVGQSQFRLPGGRDISSLAGFPSSLFPNVPSRCGQETCSHLLLPHGPSARPQR